MGNRENRIEEFNAEKNPGKNSNFGDLVCIDNGFQKAEFVGLQGRV